MSHARRTELLEALSSGGARLPQVVTARVGLFEGNWDLTAYAYQQSFEALWDHAIERTSGAGAAQSSALVVLPLLMLWRQSVELSIKAAIEGTTGQQPPLGHSLTSLFERLLEVRRERGGLEPDDDDDDTAEVMRLIAEFQTLDERAERWRYPADSKGQPYGGITVDLNRLFQAHAMITGWCDGSSVEAEAEAANLHGG